MLLKYFHIDLQAVLAINLMMNHFVKQLYDFYFYAQEGTSFSPTYLQYNVSAYYCLFPFK